MVIRRYFFFTFVFLFFVNLYVTLNLLIKMDFPFANMSFPPVCSCGQDISDSNLPTFAFITKPFQKKEKNDFFFQMQVPIQKKIYVAFIIFNHKIYLCILKSKY